MGSKSAVSGTNKIRSTNSWTTIVATRSDHCGAGSGGGSGSGAADGSTTNRSDSSSGGRRSSISRSAISSIFKEIYIKNLFLTENIKLY